MDYFRLEHLSQLDPADVTFLTRSSILESMCGPLCDVVVAGSRESASRLETLEQSSLFVVPLDRSRGWYRYHHLFREALRAELERREPELVPRCTAGPRCGPRRTARSTPRGGTRPQQET